MKKRAFKWCSGAHKEDRKELKELAASHQNS